MEIDKNINGKSRKMLVIEEQTKDKEQQLYQKLIKTKIESITKSSKYFIRNLLNDLSNNKPENANIICNYIIVEQIEFNNKDSTKIGKIKALVYLSRSCNDKKFFSRDHKANILDHLNTVRKISDNNNNHNNDNRWIGTYNFRQMIFNKFFKWLYNPTL